MDRCRAGQLDRPAVGRHQNVGQPHQRQRFHDIETVHRIDDAGRLQLMNATAFLRLGLADQDDLMAVARQTLAQLAPISLRPCAVGVAQRRVNQYTLAALLWRRQSLGKTRMRCGRRIVQNDFFRCRRRYQSEMFEIGVDLMQTRQAVARRIDVGAQHAATVRIF